MLHLTDVSVRSLAAPAKGQKDYFCNSLPGFGVRVSHGGTRSFFLFTGKENNRHRQTIGRFGIISLAQARTEAKRLLAEQTLGHGKPKSVTFSAALTIFEQQKYPELKARTVHDYKAIFRRHFSKKLGNVRLADIGFETITAITDKLVKTPSEQRHALVVAGTFFRWCVRRRFLKHNPLDGADVPKAGKRKRVLTDEELVKVYRAAQRTPYPFGPIVQLLILTGQRRGEIAALHSSWVNVAHNILTLPEGFAKNSRQHTIPLGGLALSVLTAIEKMGLLFPARGGDSKPFCGFSKSKKSLDAMLQGVAFAPNRVNTRREFFQIDPAQAIAILRLLHVEDATSEVEALATTPATEDQLAGEQYRTRRPNLNFVEMGIPAGSTLQSTNGDSVVTVIGEKKVRLGEEEMSLTAATRQVLALDYNVAPGPYWRFEGRLLKDIYNETYEQEA